MEAASASLDLTVQFPERRSECRVLSSVAIVLRGVDRWGKAFVEKTRTIDISRTGAKAMTHHSVSPGSRLRVLIPDLDRTSWGTIAWVGDKSGNQQEIGISVDETIDFWGVQLAEDDCEEAQPVEEIRAKQSMEATGKTERPAAISPPPPVESRGETESSAAALEMEREKFNKLSNAIQILAQRAIEQSLQDALQQLNRQITEIMEDMQGMILQQTQDRVRQSVEAALHQVEAAGREAIQRSQAIWQQRIKAVTDSRQGHLE